MVASISSLWLSRLVDDEIGEGTAVHAWDIRYGKSDVAYKITEGDFFPYSATSTDNSPSNEARNEYAAIPSGLYGNPAPCIILTWTFSALGVSLISMACISCTMARNSASAAGLRNTFPSKDCVVSWFFWLFSFANAIFALQGD
jgi:hypothetical protein